MIRILTTEPPERRNAGTEDGARFGISQFFLSKGPPRGSPTY
jgi:hypothetical protein